MRTIIEIPSDQIRKLSILCAQKHISRSEAIRQAIDNYLKKMCPSANGWNNAFGVWKNHLEHIDGLDYQKALRDEWDEE